ncbi:hypothetical protein PS723_00159 [Pseudomonas fluorescens]|uniref:Uncharacterized protein n=1 Tax=Pseudomonas fluorescens TaxID=294 RepID=A0A5E6ZQ80_PSEFL|nr:hypothetical protein PS723_00159 [Pseudomonas fluorescens]
MTLSFLFACRDQSFLAYIEKNLCSEEYPNANACHKKGPMDGTHQLDIFSVDIR